MRTFSRRSAQQRGAFTIVELLVSVGLLTTLMLALSAVTESASRAWREGTNRTDTFQSARTALELMTRELAPAVVDTRMQFVIGPNTIVANVVRKSNTTLADKFAPESPVLLWMAPLGENGALRCIGYYLHRDEARKFYRLKRIFIAPPELPEKPSPYFPRMVSTASARDTALRTSPVNASWFTRTWDAAAFDEEDPDNKDAVVSSAADGVIALWAQPIDLLGNPMPLLSKAKNHPKSVLDYNSAAYFQVATTKPFDSGSLVYLAETGQSMKANRVPAAVELTLVTIDSTVLQRGLLIPEQVNVQTTAGVLDVAASVKAFEEKLRANHIHTARVFTARAQLANGN